MRMIAPVKPLGPKEMDKAVAEYSRKANWKLFLAFVSGIASVIISMIIVLCEWSFIFVVPFLGVGIWVQWYLMTTHKRTKTLDEILEDYQSRHN